MFVIKSSAHSLNPRRDPFRGAKGVFERPYDSDEVPRQAALLAEVSSLDDASAHFHVQGVIVEREKLLLIHPVVLIMNLRTQHSLAHGNLPLGSVVRYQNRWRLQDPPRVTLMGYRIVTFDDGLLVQPEKSMEKRLPLAYRWVPKQRLFEGPFFVELSVSGKVLRAAVAESLTRYSSAVLRYGQHIFVNRSFACLIVPT